MQDHDLQVLVARLIASIRAACPGGRAVVAYSGGVDSTVALRLAQLALGDENVLAATAISPSLAASELDALKALAATLGVEWVGVNTNELGDAMYVRNDGLRCYACKRTLYAAIALIAAERNATLLNGVIAGDDDGTRPGVRAGREAGVLMPLADGGVDKTLVRKLARWLGLPNADKPATPCLASRLQLGTPVSIANLARIEAAEAALDALGVRERRVRDHGTLARVELPADELDRVAASRTLRDAIATAVKSAGYVYATLDLIALRSGSAHEIATSSHAGSCGAGFDVVVRPTRDDPAPQEPA